MSNQLVKNNVNIKQKINTKTVLNLTYDKLYLNIKRKLSLDEIPTFYEVIKGQCKAYIDIDKEFENENMLIENRIAVINKFKLMLSPLDEDYYIFDSSGFNDKKKSWKMSFHIIFKNIYFKNGKRVCDYLLDNHINDIDKSVYKKTDRMQLFRLPYTAKEDDNRILKKIDLDDPLYPLIEFKDIESDEYNQYIISNISNLRKMDPPVIETEDEKDARDISALGDALEEHIKLFGTKYFAIMPNTKIISIVNGSGKENTEIIKLGPARDKCPFCKRQHINNRNYILYFKNSKTYHLKCHDEDSRDKFKILYKPKKNNFPVREEDLTDISVGFLADKDESLVALYKDMLKMCFNDNIEGLLQENHIANLFINYNKSRIKIINGMGDGYVWIDNRWKFFEAKSICNMIPTFFEKVNLMIIDTLKDKYQEQENDYLKMIIKNFKIYCKNLNKFSYFNNAYKIVSAANKDLFMKINIFDRKPHLLGFSNGVLNLDKNHFRPYEKLDMITQSTGYPYRLPTNEEKNMFNDYINKVMPIDDERQLLFKILASCLRGELLENFIMLNGNGRNSKDALITSACKTVLGNDYFYQAPASILTKGGDNEINQSIANMHNKRMIVYSECKTNIKSITVKSLTGCRILPARGIYEKDNQKINTGTHFLLTQPGIDFDKIDDAVYNRLIIVPFRAMFRTQDKLDELPEETEFAYLVDSYYKSEEFLEFIKYALLDMMVQHYKIIQVDKYTINNIPLSCKELIKEYSADCNEFNQWFNENYHYIDNDVKFLKLKDIYDRFKRSDLWSNMNKSEKRKLNYKKFRAEITESAILRPFFKDRKKINNKDYKNILVKHELIPLDIMDEDMREDSLEDNII